MVKYIDIEEFLKLEKENLPIIDVRSPMEYNHAHIPNAYTYIYLTMRKEKKLELYTNNAVGKNPS